MTYSAASSGGTDFSRRCAEYLRVSRALCRYDGQKIQIAHKESWPSAQRPTSVIQEGLSAT